MTWFIIKKKKKKNHGRQYNCTLLPKYLSQEGNNMNQNSWKLQYDILTFSKKKKKKKRGLRISRFWVIRINMLILSRWPTHQYDKLILLNATKNHTNEVFKTLFEDFKKLGY